MNPLEAAIHRAIWEVDVTAGPPWKGRLIHLLRVVHALAHDVVDGQLTLRAMSLVYTTLLSLVPLLAVSFSVLKGFGVHNQIEPLLLHGLAPLGDKAPEITAKIIGFVENVKVGYLGSVGLALLFYTAVSLIQKIETSFNYTWRTTQTRSLGQRFTSYLSVIMIAPVLMFAALGLTASIRSTAAFQLLLDVPLIGLAIGTLGQLVPYLLIVGAFAFFYVFVPNARVRPVSALIGAVVAGLAWEGAGLVFASFVATSTKYAAIYSGFAILIVFMIWIYVSWLILLLGASIAYYHQNPECVTAERRELLLSSRLKDRMALGMLYLIGRDHYRERPSWTLDRLAHELAVPPDAVRRVLRPLEEAGILVRTADEPPAYAPARALERIAVEQVLDTVRAADEPTQLRPVHHSTAPVVETLLQDLDRARIDALHGRTLRDLAHTDGE